MGDLHQEVKERLGVRPKNQSELKTTTHTRDLEKSDVVKGS